MTTIYLIRHAEAEGNLYRRVHGWYNSLITENGRRQIAALEERFRDIPVDAVYSSDLYRTMTTARAVYVPKGLELHTDPGLRELNLGDWEDLTFGEVRRRFPQAMELFNRTDPAWEVENAENFFQLGDRLYGAVRRIAERHPDQTVALFSHGMALRQFLGRVKNIPPEEWHAMPHGDNTAVSRLTWDGERFEIQFEMDNSHLPEDISTLARQAWWRKGGKAKDVNLFFKPVDCPEDRDTWLRACGQDLPAGETGFLALSGDSLAGLLRLDAARYAAGSAGYIPLCFVLPEHRRKGLAIQLIGQAVAVFRPQGRDRLRMPCPEDPCAQRFCQKYGFVKTGREDGLDLMEKYIGFDR